MHQKEVKTILSSNNGMNLFRGCEHGCIYCDSRSKCYHIEHDFEDILVKSNSLLLLEEALKKKRKKVMIKTGSMSDPYIPIEQELQITRRALELILKYGHGVSIQTKSDLILRDFDLIKKINDNTKAVVEITLTTYDDNLCRLIEPNVCPTSKRLEVIKKFTDANIPVVVWLTPFLPFINDTHENISSLLDALIKLKVTGIVFFGIGLTLRDGNREYFYNKLDTHFKGLKDKYIKCFNARYEVFSKNNKELSDYVISTCKKNNIMINQDDVFSFINNIDKKDAQPIHFISKLNDVLLYYFTSSERIVIRLTHINEIPKNVFIFMSNDMYKRCTNILNLINDYLEKLGMYIYIDLYDSDLDNYQSFPHFINNIIITSSSSKETINLNTPSSITYNSISKSIPLINYSNILRVFVIGLPNDDIMNYDLILSIRNSCIINNVPFTFLSLSSLFLKDGKMYKLKETDLVKQAFLANINYKESIE